MKRTCPEYPLFLIETPETGCNCSVYWVPDSNDKAEFIGTVPYSQVLADEALENLLELSITDNGDVFVGGKIEHGTLFGGVFIGTVYEKNDFYWHHVFAAEKRKTLASCARAMYKRLRLHRTSIGATVLEGFK